MPRSTLPPHGAMLPFCCQTTWELPCKSIRSKAEPFAVALEAKSPFPSPSNLNTLLKTIPPYWSTLLATFHKRMGDSEAVLKEESPLFKADQIKVPLLIGQGANDPSVNKAESDQIVAAMRKNDKPVQYYVFPDEGHGFARPTNNMAFNAVSEEFLAKYLGGRFEPATADESKLLASIKQ